MRKVPLRDLDEHLVGLCGIITALKQRMREAGVLPAGCQNCGMTRHDAA